MNIYNLRHDIAVTVFYTHMDGATIGYTKNRSLHKITITRDLLKLELIAIGSLDENVNSAELAGYQISQWDALNIAIRYEAAREQEKELENSDLFKAIAKITKP